MHKFKAGDQVICVNANDQKRLNLGQVYEVEKVDGYHKIFVKGYKRFSFLSKRFEYEK